jgi:TonB dependent receptor/TonB-dependent Receptor Plug Domain
MKSHALRATALASLAAMAAPAVHANHAAPVVGAPQTLIVQGHYNNAVGTTNAASAGTIGHELMQNRSAQRPGEVLEFVPGVIVTQHSGDGKANQYFLRGFNLDHGTDFATRLGGMPLNLPSHGHGQGYTDLNFLIPELVDRIDYRKGPYFASVGNFSAAGSADIRYLPRVTAPFGQVTLGKDGYRRGVVGMSADVAVGVTALGAIEGMEADGPWDVPQGLRKQNGVFMLTGGTRDEGWHAAAMAYRSRWTATDQIPQRLIDAGQLNGQPFGRYGSLDPTTGGNTSRVSLSGEWHRQNAAGRSSVSAYAVRYDLDLNSNFTYAQERPAQGDQFKQTDQRSIFGLDAEHRFEHDVGSLPFSSTIGLQLRHDRIRNGLYDSAARRITDTVREDRIRETMAGLWLQSAVELTPAWRAVLGLRVDHLRAEVDALSLPVNGGKASDTQVSPKLAVIWSATPRTELFYNVGRGLHSNDARGMTARVDPRTGDAVSPVPGLVPVLGQEIGLRTEAIAGLQTSVALWSLRSASELVYVGDAGTTEASAGSRRRGIEISNRWQATPWLLVDADIAFNHARFSDGSRIPNAVDRVASIAGTVSRLPALPGWTASLQLRHLGPGALIEDNSVRSIPSSTLNLRVTRELGNLLGKGASVTLDVFNLGNRQVNDIQYFYESRLPGETAAVADRHVHPAEPRSVRLTLQAQF